MKKFSDFIKEGNSRMGSPISRKGVMTEPHHVIDNETNRHIKTYPVGSSYHHAVKKLVPGDMKGRGGETLYSDSAAKRYNVGPHEKKSVKEAIVPQPSKHVVYHNQGKGASSSVAPHNGFDSHAEAQAHIKKLQAQGDKRNLEVQKKAQFSKVVKEAVHDRAKEGQLTPDSHKAWQSHHKTAIKKLLTYPDRPTNHEELAHHAKELHRHTKAIHKLEKPGERT